MNTFKIKHNKKAAIFHFSLGLTDARCKALHKISVQAEQDERKTKGGSYTGTLERTLTQCKSLEEVVWISVQIGCRMERTEQQAKAHLDIQGLLARLSSKPAPKKKGHASNKK